jgi:YHS domain-containing protein
MTTRRVLLMMFAGAAAAISAGSALAQTQSKAPMPERLALKGYDPVAYFTERKPIAGLPEFEQVWDGQRYRFATARHRDMFKADPEKYAPQFGGACAMNLANGRRRESDPNNWVISNGHLYVFATTAGADRFREDPLNAAQSAEANWQTIRNTANQ